MEIIKPFQYLNEILGEMMKGEALSIYEANLTGPRKSGKSISVELFSWYAMMLTNNQAKVLVLRKNSDQLIDTYYEYLGLYDRITNRYPNIYINNTLKRVKLWNNNELRGKSINTNRKSSSPKSDVGVGLQNFNTKYLILHFEEAHQFTLDEIQAIEEAARGYEYMISIRTSNPWSIKNDFIAYCNRNLKYDPNILTNPNGAEQFFIKNEKYLFHYSRFENNPHLTKQEIDSLNNLKERDPRRARISAFGLPGISAGGIYTDYLDRIKDVDAHHMRPEYYLAGVDWGETKSSSTANLWGVGYNNKWIAGYDAYEWNNEKNAVQKNSQQMAEEVVDFYYKLATGPHPGLKKGLTVNVDYAAFGVIALLQSIAKARGMFWIEFVPCEKLPIHTRIDITTAMISLGMVHIHKTNMSALLSEMDLSVWDEEHMKDGLPIRLKQDDHHLDAWEYAFGSLLYDLGEEYELILEKR